MSTSELINNIKDGDNVTANKTFDSLLKSKLNDALDAEKIKVAGEIYNGDEPEQVEMEFDEVETSEEEEEMPDIDGHPV